MFRRKQAKPQRGDWRIEEVTLGNGARLYKAQEYNYDPWAQQGWNTELTSSNFADAKAHVETKMGARVVSRRVVWP